MCDDVKGCGDGKRCDVDRGGGEVDPGEFLIERRGVLDRGEATWLEVLDRFDREQRWALDGQLSGVDWLVWRTKMSRGTAFEKLRVARELRRRPSLAAAFRAGVISYSAVRAISRLDRPDPAVDDALIELAQAGRVRDLEHAVRHYQLCADQDRPPSTRPDERRGLRIQRRWDGLAVATIVLDAVEMDELEAAIAAFGAADDQPGPGDDSSRDDGPTGGDHSGPGDDSSRDDEPTGGDHSGPGDDSSHDDRPTGEPGDGANRERLELSAFWQRQADAFMNMIRAAGAHIGAGAAGGADRYLVHIVTGPDGHHGERLDGTPLDPAVVARICCDASTVVHETGSDSEPLRLGRRTRTWNQAQRRAITVRDGGTCRFPGCTRRSGDIHHLLPWSHGGPTDIENGIYVCTHHHTLLHQQFTATGNANRCVTIHHGDGTVLAQTVPPHRHLQAA